MKTQQSQKDSFLPEHVPGLFPEIKPKSKSNIVNMLIEGGYCKNESSAKLLLIIFVVILILVSIFIYMSGFSIPVLDSFISDLIN
jgi:hypothetical protein